MLSKCANPACDARLHYLHQGKIFRIDTESLARTFRRAKPATVAVPVITDDSRPIGDLPIVADRGGSYRPEYFWLCAECSEEWTIAVQSGTVIVVPLSRSMVQHAAAS